ncbi:putative membrane protein YphA (DoxX/SURF4 family) [Desulfomicrobium macestii]|uniref:Methylamine utilisation protein MauE n=2 Tax=Desulfomicrobium TaxID=898 RepID=A0A8G2C2A6_DESNO|nr:MULTISPECIES: MauE/DoxX family redox-associated membrane protein [Desulfomicrobium]MBE1425755.1 putative membrane protein YphA (DoxX/SURF4 family) [Desulfomicrobium macestii]SFL63708.1 Methylamine utilisation protein MauE [Desulfomicrobium norvegicum]
MIPIHWKSWSYAAVRIALALAFLVAGITKILDPMTFAVTIDAFGILPGPLIPPVAVFLPLLEIMGAVALIFDIRGSLGLITLMILMFIAVLGYGMHMGLDIDCGCYGPGDTEGEAFAGIRDALWRDLIMLGCAATLYAWRKVMGVRPGTFAGHYRSIKTFISKEETA